MDYIADMTPHYAYQVSSIWEWQVSPSVAEDTITWHETPDCMYVVGQLRHLGNDGAFLCPIDIASGLGVMNG